MSSKPEPPVMNRAALYRVIHQAEEWADRGPRSDSDVQQAWRTGFAAGMQRLEIYADPIIRATEAGTTPEGDPDAA